MSLEYFAQKDPFAHFVVHEVSHVFHDTKRTTVGLPASRSKEWLLDIDYSKCETFAYACEAFSRVLEQAKTSGQRRALAEEFGRQQHVFDERADPREIASIVRDAAVARNGWKAILTCCAPGRWSGLCVG